MGATLSRCFSTADECDRWAEQQSQLAARWNLQKTADLGNTPVLRVPVIRPDGSRSELAVPLDTEANVEGRVRATLTRTARHRGYREDPTRRRTRGYIRSLRFD